MQHYFISLHTLAFNVARPLPAALFRKAMKHDVYRRNRFYFVESTTRAVSPTYLRAGSRITLLRIPCDNAVNHADRSGQLSSSHVFMATQKICIHGDICHWRRAPLFCAKFYGLIIRRDCNRMTDKRYA